MTRKRVDYNIPGPLYIHRWLKPGPDYISPETSMKWVPRDSFDVDLHLFLKTQKYPRDELMIPLQTPKCCLMFALSFAHCLQI